jgi:hypothetical protein
MLANNGARPVERRLRELAGLGSRPTQHNPEAGSLLITAAITLAVTALAALAAMVRLVSIETAFGATGFAAVVVSMGVAKYVAFTRPLPGDELFADAEAPLFATMFVGGAVLAVINVAVATVTALFGHHRWCGLLALFGVDAAAMMVVAKERELEDYFSGPNAKKRT